MDIMDTERAGKIAGSRFFYLKKEGVLLDMALISFALEEMVKKGYSLNRATLFNEERTLRGCYRFRRF